MSEQREVLTQEQKDALEAELQELEGPRRARAIEEIATARSFGDLSENFEYHAAKNEQGLLEARIRTLRSRLENSVLVDESMLNAGEVGVGSRVAIDDDGGTRMEIEISSVGGAGTVSPDSPLGRAVLGRREGDSVEVQAPRGSWTARIVSVTQP